MVFLTDPLSLSSAEQWTHLRRRTSKPSKSCNPATLSESPSAASSSSYPLLLAPSSDQQPSSSSSSSSALPTKQPSVFVLESLSDFPDFGRTEQPAVTAEQPVVKRHSPVKKQEQPHAWAGVRGSKDQNLPAEVGGVGPVACSQCGYGNPREARECRLCSVDLVCKGRRQRRT